MTVPPRPQHHVRDVVDRLDTLTERETLALRDVVEAFGATSFLPMLMLPALLVVSPLSGIPGFSSLCGLTIALISGQRIARRDHLWLPDVLMRRRMSGARLRQSAQKVGGLADWLDRRARDRLTLLVVRPLIFLAIFVAGMSMPFLEIVPFSSSILGCAVLCFTLALLAHDGLFVLIGAAVMGVAALIPLTVATGLAAL